MTRPKVAKGQRRRPPVAGLLTAAHHSVLDLEQLDDLVNAEVAAKA